MRATATLSKVHNEETKLSWYHFTPIGRFLVEDIGQTVIQVMFLAKHDNSNPTVVASVVVGIALSTATAIGSIREICGCKKERLAASRTTPTKTVQTQRPGEATV